ncbi:MULTISPECIES: DUF975 family protein [unclassified Lacticaseibacillus]|uniref:DUF975 family protein n=1 Tax=unclassified Lacticaseibacillus TaxID=2759744 RepID=UPI001944654C|nr:MULTISPECIES: DUF975 family protein [unclassified Lacticaseibacillus]
MTRAEIKQQAKDRLHGKWGWAIGLDILGAIMGSLVGGITVGILAAMVATGVTFSYLHLIDHDDKGNGVFNNIFSAFTGPHAMAVFLNMLLASIFLALWSLLLVIPGIIKGFSYSQVPYILRDMQESGSDIGATDAIKASRELMNGHKWEYFVLQLSFIGWRILASIPFGLGNLWLTPYIRATNAAYYRQLAGDQFRTQPQAAESDTTQA